jgi:3-hydroxyacyl-CoA dehydrogenase/enoyl-CoA hydratase/3-hydroxybutyryl-CoA epimerase
LIDGVGVEAFVRRCDELAGKFGARFAPPQMLRDMAARGESFYGAAVTAKAAEKRLGVMKPSPPDPPAFI